MAKLPKTIYVYEEKPANDAAYLVVERSADGAAPDIGEKRIVGRYELRESFSLTTESKIIKK